MLTVVDSVDGAWGSQVAQGLRRFTEPPDWLVALDDPETVAAALVRCVPEFSSGALTLSDCEVDRVRLRDGSWMGQYTLVVAEGGAQRTVKLRARMVEDADLAPSEVPSQGVGSAGPQGKRGAGSAGPQGKRGAGSAGPQGKRGAFGDEAWTCYVPELRFEFRTEPPDSGLTSLPALTDPEKARALLERGIRASSPDYAALRIETCRPQVMRYKPGSRCTVLYHLTYPPEASGRGWPNPVVAKTHHGPKGRNAHESMAALWNSPLRLSRNVTVAEPLGFLEDESVLLQGPIREEITLKKQLRASYEDNTPQAIERLSSILVKTGRGLADLHACGVTVGTPWTFEDEMAEVRERIESLTDYVPHLAGAGEPVLERLTAIARAHPANPLVPSHRSFRPAQVLIAGEEIGFIDFDSFCQGEPALDLALFVATFSDLSMRALQTRDGLPGPGQPPRRDHLSLVDDLCGAFLAGYDEVSSVQASPERVDLWHALLVFDRIVTCWTKNRFERLPHCMGLLTHLYGKDDLTRLVA